MEVKIGVQHAPREIVVNTDESADDLAARVAEAVASSGLLAITDARQRQILVPGDRIAYVEMGGAAVGQVGFR